MATKHALVVGGSGFLGSSVCRALLKHGFAVTSLARNGKPSYTGAQEPSWSKNVNWIQGSAFDEALLKRDVLPNVDCVVHTLGILFEEDYKSNGIHSLAKAIKDNIKDRLLMGSGSSARRGASSSLLGTFLQDNSKNPLAVRREAQAFTDNGPRASSNNNTSEPGAYERINRDSALTVLRAFLETRPKSSSSPLETPISPFIYVSAEDIFRPFVPDRYISTKREAEWEILRMAETARTMVQTSEELAGENEGENMERPARLIRPVLVRPGLMFDYDTRPITRLPTTLLKLSTAIQETLPSPFRAQTLSKLLSSVGDSYNPSASSDTPPNHASLANLLSTPPLHVDVVAEAITRAIELPQIDGVLDVQDMRSMVEGKGTGDHTYSAQTFA